MLNSVTFIAMQEHASLRIDKFISQHMEEMSRSYIQKLIKDNQVFINEKVSKANHKLKVGEKVRLLLPVAVEPDITPENIPIEVMYEDEDIIIINKEKGMVVHPAAGHYKGTLVNAVMYHCKNQLSGINGVMRPGIVHRIDKDTTGSIIICKNDKSHSEIAKQLKDHTITRKYRAIVHGHFKESEGTIVGTIGRHPTDRKKMAMNVRNGKEAITNYRVIKEFQQYSYVECQLETGRTHQIRVHLTSINHPILGDEKYGTRTSPFKLQGQTLHAMTIGFIHPTMKKYMEFEAPLPKYFQHLLDILQ